MLYVFHGSDIEKSRVKSHNLINSLRAKKPDASFVTLDADTWSVSTIQEHIGGQGLFSNKYIVLLDRVTENIEAKEDIAGFVEAMEKSANIFIVLEGKMNVEFKKSFEKYAEKVVIHDLPAAGKLFGARGEFNIFSLADAVGNRDRLKSWSIYRQAVDRGSESESILGTLFWQVKSMILATAGKSATEAGLSPFVFSKSKRASANYSMDELKTLLTKITALYHDGHRGIVDLKLGTEKLLLEL
jgi:DNA polymerase III delta subunit